MGIQAARARRAYNLGMNELAQALIGNSAFAPPSQILEDIPESAAHTVPELATPGLIPHTVYAEVWHMAFWQHISLNWAQGIATPYPEHARESFPTDTAEPWDALRERFLAGTQNAAALAQDADKLEEVVACPRVGNPARTMTVREQLESLAAHNAYHLGRIVLQRQLLGIWPPPGGGETW